MRQVLLDTPSGETLSCTVAEGFVDRLVGLMGHAEPPPANGLLISPCRSVHTAFMRFASDIVFLDAEGRVLRVTARTPPWRVRFAPRRTRRVLELAGGEAERLGLAAGGAVTSSAHDEG